MKWKDVTLRQFNRLQEALKIEDEEEKVIEIAEIMLGEDVVNLPISEFKKKISELSFLSEPIPNSIPPKKITVNGHKYYVDCLLGNITTAQYIDFTNHSKTNDLSKILSAFLIPESRKYNDGYDMIEVMNDINDLPITVVNDIAFFFGRQFSVFMRIFQRYSLKQIEKTDLPKEVKESLMKAVEYSVDLGLSPLS